MRSMTPMANGGTRNSRSMPFWAESRFSVKTSLRNERKRTRSAALAALLVRFRSFRKLVFTENRDSAQKGMLLLFLVPPFAIGVMLRIFGGGYHFFDLTLEGSFLMGLIGGRIVGLLGGSLISLPAFGNHEWLSSPLAALIGLLAGMVRETMPEKEDIWHFGPFLFLSVPEWIGKLIRYGKGNWAMLQ